VPSPCYLNEKDFSKIIEKYSSIPAEPFQDYSVQGMEKMAEKRFSFLCSKYGSIPKRVLEIGAGAGFVLKRFKEAGSQTSTSIDVVDQLYPEVRSSGVTLELTTAERIENLDSSSYDIIFSYGTLEHIPNPRQAHEECCRLLAPGGYYFMEFGPLFYSSWGYHHKATLRCPYLHLLFPEIWIHQLCREKRGNDYMGYLPWVNGKPVESYRFCWESPAEGFKTDYLRMGRDWYDLNLISRFLSVFKSKGVTFENFLVDGISLGLRKDST